MLKDRTMVKRIVLGNRTEVGEIKFNRRQDDYSCQDVIDCKCTKCENCIFYNDELQPQQFVEILIERAEQ